MTNWSIDEPSPAPYVAYTPNSRPPRRARTGGRLVREIVETVVAAAVLFVLVQAVVQSYQVEGPSMEPSVHNNELLLVNKIIYLNISRETIDRFLPFIDITPGDDFYPFHSPKRGEVIVLRGPDGGSRDFIKRIVALPGDTLTIRRGEINVNGTVVNEPYIMEIDRGAQLPPTKIPKGSYFVMGDNRPVSRDSRAWGPITEDMIIGKGWLAYWPFEKFGFLGHSQTVVADTR